MNEHTTVVLSLVLLAGVLCQWLAWRVKLPAILFLLLCGITTGPLLGWLRPDELLGELLFPFVSLSVAVILFEGSLTLKFSEIRGLRRVIRNMITYGMLITWIITALATRLLLGFPWELACLFGAMMTVTGPTVIVPMLRTVRPNKNIANILRWEGILIDPIGAIMSVLVYEFIVSGGAESGFRVGILVFLKILAIGGLLGVAGGQGFGTILRRFWIPHYLQSIAALAAACGIFALSNAIEAESGLMAVTVMGVWLANMDGIELEEILDFKEHLSMLLISMLFILLAARMELADLSKLGWPALGVLAAIQFLARPLNAQISAIGSKLTMAERHLLAWIAPRGIIAAAISALFAIKLAPFGHPEAALLIPLTFMVIIGTVVLQSATAGPIARWLKVAEPEPSGFLIIGANAVARAIGAALSENECRVQLADQDWRHVREAKLAGLPTYYGNPVSEHAERHLSLIGVGRVLAITPSMELNTLATQHYRLEFGPNNLHTIRLVPPDEGAAKKKASFRFGGRLLFDATLTYESFQDALASGADIITTPLTRKFSFQDYVEGEGWHRHPLFAIDPKGHIHVFSEGVEVEPEDGWHIIGLGSEEGRVS